MILKTKAGREISYTWAGISELDLNLYIGTTGLTIPEAVNIFCDPKETAKLTLIMDEQNPNDETNQRVLEGYTRFTQVRINPVEGTIIVGLGKE